MKFCATVEESVLELKERDSPGLTSVTGSADISGLGSRSPSHTMHAGRQVWAVSCIPTHWSLPQTYCCHKRQWCKHLRSPCLAPLILLQRALDQEYHQTGQQDSELCCINHENSRCISTTTVSRQSCSSLRNLFPRHSINLGFCLLHHGFHRWHRASKFIMCYTLL